MRIRKTETVVEVKRGGLIKKLAVLFGVVAGGLVVATVFVSVSFASKGSQLMLVEKEIEKVSAENNEIREQVVKRTSVSDLVAEIDKTDFTDPETLEYLSADMALQPEIIAKLP